LQNNEPSVIRRYQNILCILTASPSWRERAHKFRRLKVRLIHEMNALRIR